MPYIKAAVRDIKAFRNSRGYRAIPIAYTATDIAAYRNLTANYLACGSSDDTIDVFGLNIYSWCGNSSYYLSGYDTLYTQFQQLNIPSAFSETGCKPDSGHRDFSEVATMLGPVFQALFSGAVVYEWAMEQSGFGIVQYANDSVLGFPTTLDDYNALSTVFSTARPTGTAMTAYTPSNSPPACPSSDSTWLVNAADPLPTIPGLDMSTVTARTTIASHGASSTGTGGGAQGASNPAAGGADGGQPGSGGHVLGGAIAGIVLGCVAAVVGLGAIGFFFFKWRAKRRRMNEKLGLSHAIGSQQGGFKAELPAKSVGPVMQRQEMDAWEEAQQPQVAPHSGAQDHIAQQQGMYEVEGSVPAASELPHTDTNDHAGS